MSSPDLPPAWGNVPPAWASVLAPQLAALEFARLYAWLRAQEAAGATIYPPQADRFRALELTGPDAVKVVILGQDPYHGAGQAHGLAFSVPDGVRIPPSLANIARELSADLGLPRRQSGNLEPWARQGVLLLNSALSVEEARPGSHQGQGWEALTDAIVAAVAARPEPGVFMLWGAHAQAKAARVPALGAHGPHLVLTAPHPSPLSAHRGFLGCRHFSQVNAFLVAHGQEPIDWA